MIDACCRLFSMIVVFRIQCHYPIYLFRILFPFNAYWKIIARDNEVSERHAKVLLTDVMPITNNEPTSIE